MSELKPCAHCGHPMEINRRNRYGDITYVLSCTNPECHLNAPQNRSTFKIKEEAVIANNTRYERTCRIEMVSPGEWECSKCGSWIDWDSPYEDDPPSCKYCPACGAKVV